jgi:hypothetical protein
MASIHRVSAIIAYANGNVASYAVIHDGDITISAPEDAAEFATLEAEVYSFPSLRAFMDSLGILLAAATNIDHIDNITWSVDMEDETGRQVIGGFEANGAVGENSGNAQYNPETFPNFDIYIENTEIDADTATASATMRPNVATVAAGGSGYVVPSVLTFVGGTFTTAGAVTVVSLSTILGQNEVDYTLTETNGSFTPGTGYDIGNTITLTDGTIVTVDSVGTAGDVLTFDITTSSTSGIGNSATLTQSSTSGSGTGFSLSLLNSNQGVFAVALVETAEVPNGEYTALPSNPVATSAGAPQVGATLTVTWSVRNVTVTDGGAGYSAAPAVTFSGNATGTTTLTGDVVTAVTVVSAGTGYTTVANVTIAAPSA